MFFTDVTLNGSQCYLGGVWGEGGAGFKILKVIGIWVDPPPKKKPHKVVG